MIKVTYRQLKSGAFLMATQKIYQAKMNIRSAKRVATIFKELDKEKKICQEVFDSQIRDKHMKSSAQDPDVFNPLEGKEHEDVVKEFLETVVEINMPRLTTQELFHVELSPSDIETLDGLIGEE